MSKFFVGQRVKKVWGKDNVGHTGVIVAIDLFCPFGLTLQIKVTQLCTGYKTISKESICIHPGSVAWGNPKFYEPILDQNQPCESGFKESLDNLLERVTEDVRG